MKHARMMVSQFFLDQLGADISDPSDVGRRLRMPDGVSVVTVGDLDQDYGRRNLYLGGEGLPEQCEYDATAAARFITARYEGRIGSHEFKGFELC